MIEILKKILVVLITIDIIKNLLREDKICKFEIIIWQIAVLLNV